MAINSYENELYNIIRHDQRYLVMTAENLAAIRGLPNLLGAERFIDTGIAEQTLVGAACGLALRGRIPVVHALAAFLTMRAYEFIRTDIGLSGLPVKLVGSVPGFLSTLNGPTHQAIEDIALMASIPAMHIFCPADNEDLLIGLRAAIESPHPTYIRLNQQPSVFEHSRQFFLGQAETVLKGDDIAILTYGLMFKNAYEASSIIRNAGFSVRLLNMRTLKPLDRNAVSKAVRETKLMVTVEDHIDHGGLAAMVRQVIVEERQQIKMLTFALQKHYEPGGLDEVIEKEGYSGSQLAKKILMAMK